MHFIISIYFGLQAFALAQEPIRIDVLRTREEIDSHYCKVTTGTLRQIHERPCSTPNHFPVDVIYVPQSIGEQIVAHINSAWDRGLYLNISNTDFFHGHPITKGPQTTYRTPQEYFADFVGYLYHSDEYTGRWDSSSSPTKLPRSFVGLVNQLDIVPAFDLIKPGIKLGNYLRSGTIYMETVLESQPQLSKWTGVEKIYVNTAQEDKPCEVINSVHFINDPKGRFKVASGETLEMIVHCKYYRQ